MADEQEPPVKGAEAEAKIVDALKDTFVGRIVQDRMDAKAKEAEEKPEEVPAPEGSKVKATPAPSKKAERQKPVTKEDKDDETKAETKKEPEPKPEAKPDKPKKKAEPKDNIAEIAGRAAAAALEEQRRNDRRSEEQHYLSEQRKRDEAAERSVPDAVKKLASAYEELHHINPAKYPPDLKDRMTKFVTAELKRADEWETANEGEVYDSEAEEHAEWYAKNMPVIDQDDLMEARIAVKARETVEKEVRPRQAELETKLRNKELEPVLLQAANSLGKDIVKGIVPEFEGEVSEETLKKLGEENPLALEVAISADRHFARVVYDAGMLWSGAKFDPQNPSHQSAKQFLAQFEQALASVPPEDTMRDNGTRWIPMATYVQLPPAQQKNFYTTEYAHLVDYIRSHVAPNAAKTHYENELKKGEKFVELLAPKMGYQKNGAGRTTPVVDDRDIVKKAVEASPTMGAGSPPGNNPSGNGTKTQNFQEQFFSRLGVR